MLRSLLIAAVLVAATALAQLSDLASCSEEHDDCNEGCSLRYGLSTKVENLQKLGECRTRCDASERRCREMYYEIAGAHPGNRAPLEAPLPDGGKPESKYKPDAGASSGR